MLINILTIVIASILAGILVWLLIGHYFKKKLEEQAENFKNQLSTFQQEVSGKTNSLKGDIGELIAYSKIASGYDRIFHLHNVVDFIAIRFPKGPDKGTIDFVEIKNSNRTGRLSKDQRMVKTLIDNKLINFIKLEIKTDISRDLNDIQKPISNGLVSQDSIKTSKD